ncbi:cob(I)yrinic acid a,c-diamide adenosyltransferase [soil metagenome]
MGHRLTRIATRTGDAGTTGLGDGSRIAKDSLRIAALGDVDELNASIGLLLCEAIDDPYRSALVTIQHDLFDLGGETSIPGHALVGAAHVLRLDNWLEDWNADLPRLANFILPAGTRAASQAHVCRTVARRAERAFSALGNQEAVSGFARQYLNRLSDLLFVLARCLNRAERGDDVLWNQHGR